MEQHQPHIIERKGNKRRVVEAIQKQPSFADPINIVPSSVTF
jgi:hypothetical protein